MGLSSFEILDILELLFFVPALIASAYVVYKQGIRKRLGWRFLIMICLFRLVGAITSLIAVRHPSSGLTITYDVMNSFGLSAIISTALALLDRVEDGMASHGLHHQIFQLLHLPSLVGIILSVVGSTDLFSDSHSNVSTGFTLLKTAICLFLVVFVADILITGHCFLKISHVLPGERGLLFAVALALPFMAVRMIFSLLCVFANDPKWFSSWSLEWTAILIHAIFGVLMEAIIVTIFIVAGFITAPAALPLAHEGKVTYALGARSV
ncbi:uncharacterized protein Z520_01432 [Fonsecaea multimorphosa CBS 102226]|uniref:DUF7702 domain-containing protein n=1 Tax=Fonsecaea multimorphosa CBS 102226 TaxID=1442371 RepID=A0A0D2J0U0_9EURO|nr:uncharacterized protein Z520_01432 [Fonsecaea multimorphosa CBS 102226]KIY02967.1 hypothetical protein Z520_01432 [Fonsecaea multimorphosa CBS 102226]OAL30798.1 hypothetical protein AYO22_01418 [Fonsecaea multimorphosa]